MRQGQLFLLCSKKLIIVKILYIIINIICYYKYYMSSVVHGGRGVCRHHQRLQHSQERAHHVHGHQPLAEACSAGLEELRDS